MRTHLIAGLALAALLAGCGNDDPAVSGESATATDAAAGGDSVEITAVDYAFEGIPDTVAAGTELTLTNASEGEVHEMVVMKIDDDETRPIEELLAEGTDGPPPDFLTFAGVAVALPGEEGFAPEGPVVLDEPGRYVMLCFIPTGADPAAYEEAMSSDATEAPQVDGGPPHVAEGMAAEFTVE
jgi:hypothetical protein